MAHARPVGAAEFAAAMAQLEPFESAPELAVAVSGGRDSLALTLLADDWARTRRGRVLALTVEHGLRAESQEEARQVAAWLEARGIAHRILHWRGEKPRSGLQQAARTARYRLLERACRRRGILHLLLAHQWQDQLATHLMRRAHGSGSAGLAAMSAQRREGGVRLLRPLLALRRERLAATLRQRRQPWLDDPSNLDPGFERTRIERALEAETAPQRLVRAVQRAGRARAALEEGTAALAAGAVRLSPLGFALLAPGALAAAPAELAGALLRRLLMTIGGGAYPPGSDRLDRLLRDLRAGRGLRRTLGGCRIAPWRGHLAFARETRHLGHRMPIAAGGRLAWDRFACRLTAAPEGSFHVAMLGDEGWRRVRPALGRSGPALPGLVPAGLPALWDPEGPLVVPHLRFHRPDAAGIDFSAAFRPLSPLTTAPFAVASPPPQTI